MNREEQKQILNREISQTGITLSDKQTDQFLMYFDLLTEWNQKINLTAITEYHQVVLKHFTDSVSACRFVAFKQGDTLIDVGTGAGFPGIPLKIVFPEMKVLLLDSLRKRVDFLNLVIDQLQLNEGSFPIDAVHGRAEEYAHSAEHRGVYDYAVSRAVSNLSTISEYCVPFLKETGTFIAYKSGDLRDELDQSVNGIQKLGAYVENTETFSLSDGSEKLDRTFVFVKKTGKTPDQYPRRAGIPEKRPLK